MPLGLYNDPDMEKYTRKINDLRSEVIVEKLRAEAREYNDPLSYLQSLANRYQYMPVHDKMLMEIAQFIEPKDRVLGEDEEMGRCHAFYRGGLVALRAIEEVGGIDLLSYIPQQTIPIPDTQGIEDEEEKAHIIAQGIMEVGAQGYATASHLTSLLEDDINGWEDVFVPDVRFQRAQRCGLGFMIFIADRVIQQIDLERMQGQANSLSDFDWDAELRTLTPEI